MKSANVKYQSVMIVDSDEIDNFIDERLIKGYNFAQNVYVHSNLKSAFENLKQISEQDVNVNKELLPRYLFLDMNTQKNDNFDFLAEYEKLSSSLKKEINIVMLMSGLNTKDGLESKYRKGSFKYVMKPLTEKILLQL